MMAELSAEKTYIFEEMPIVKAVMKLVVPSVLAQVVTLIYNMADTFFVGRTGDAYQVAAVSMTYTLYFVLTALSSLYGVGGGSYISRLLGAKRVDVVKKASSFSLYAGLATTVLVSLIICVFMRPILIYLGASDNTYDFCYSYAMWVVVYGGIPTVASLIMGNLLRSEGYSRQAGYGIAIGGVLNIILDPVFIFGFGLGVTGAAVATVISNVLACVYYLIVFRALKGKTVLSLSPKHFRFDREVMKQVYLIGLPTFVASMLTTIANSVSFSLISNYDDIAVAAFGITKKLDMVPMCVCFGVSNGVLPIIAYNYAAKNIKRMEKSFYTALKIGLGFGILYLAAARLFPSQIVRFFIDHDPTVQVGASFVAVECLAVPFTVITNLINTSFQAMGKGFPSLVLSACRSAILKIPTCLLFNALIGVMGIIWSQFATDVIMLLVSIPLFVSLLRKVKKENEKV